MRLATAKDLVDVNTILNASEVRPHMWEAHAGPIALTEDDLSTFKVYITDDKSGCFIGESLGNGRYLGASAFLKGSWGLPAVAAHIEAINHIMISGDCIELYGIANRKNRRAIRNMSGIGMTRDQFSDTHVSFRMTWRDWAKNSRLAINTGRHELSQIGGRPCKEEAGIIGGLILCSWNMNLKKAYDEVLLESKLSPGVVRYPEIMVNEDGRIGLKFEFLDDILVLG